MSLRYIQRRISVHILSLGMKQESECLPHVGHHDRVCVGSPRPAKQDGYINK
jgi:hypothetical protein